MIIKRSLKSTMPTLKRCRVIQSSNTEDEDSIDRKRRKFNPHSHSNNNGKYFPLSLLGEVASGVIPFSGFHGIFSAVNGDRHSHDDEHSNADVKGFSASWCTEVSCSLAEEEDEEDGGGRRRMSQVKSRHVAEVEKESPRPPLVRTSRGRAQVLPSRFNDSILDDWKKERGSKGNSSDKNGNYRECDDDEEEEEEEDEFDDDDDDDDYIDYVSVKKNGKFGSKNQKGKLHKFRSNVLKFEDETYGGSISSSNEDYGYVNGFEEEEEYGRQMMNHEMRRYTSSRCGLMSLRDRGQWMDHKKPGIGVFGSDARLMKDRRKNGEVGRDEFVPGDIVWAMLGKNDPAWPAIVIHPASQAPRQVLEYRVPGAFCVMFFGYSQNGKQRVRMNHSACC